MDLRACAREKRLIVAHRGVSGGNIPCNTIAAYEIALQQGADMIEIDVSRSQDGELFIFHPGMESAHLNQNCSISQMNAAEVRALRFVNQDNAPTQFGLNTLDEVLETFKDRCFINCDKFWEHPKEITDCIRRHGMADQILVKTSANGEIFDFMESYAPEIPYMLIAFSDESETHRNLKSRRFNYLGQELIFESDSNPICSDEYLENLRKDGILTWVNALVYSHTALLAGGHNDDISVTGHPELGWGWLVEKNFDLIQTDWPGMLREYLLKRKQLSH